jgi:cell division protein FtsW
LNGPPGKSVSFLICMVIVALLAMQPDFGQAALVLFGWGVVYFVAGAPMTLIAIVVGMVAVGGFAAYESSEHFARRIDGFLTPDLDPRTQLGYATNAIQEGGFFGVGVGAGQVKWSLPDAHTDFIIAVVGEELGLVGLSGVLLLYTIVIVRGLRTAIALRDSFGKLLAAGLASTLGIQLFIVVGGVTGLIPLTGLTTPWMSYGGSSLLANYVLLAILVLLSHAARRPLHTSQHTPIAAARTEVFGRS